MLKAAYARTTSGGCVWTRLFAHTDAPTDAPTTQPDAMLNIKPETAIKIPDTRYIYFNLRCRLDKWMDLDKGSLIDRCIRVYVCACDTVAAPVGDLKRACVFV